ncbi:unnamed protein product [Didymodactylos carnosus]|nr:unnamed protein product [Didymodactylos carnosus]CAF4454057.1 unnamed protein product [Didymodactylos carnosus]
MAQFMKVWSEKQDWPNILWMNKAFISSEENFRRPLNCIFNKSNPEKQNQQQQQQLEEKEQKTIITKVHYFSSEEIRTIKKEASQRLLSNRYISSYDALYSHLCHVISKATQTDLEPSFKICQFFNGRRLFEKDEYFGSLAFWLYEHVTKCAIHQLSLSNLANIIHDMHEKQTINTLTKYNSYLDTGITIRSNYIDADIINSDYHATSWRNFGFYNIDFGYGKPMYTGPTIQLNQRYMTIMDTLLNDGSIYVILGLKQEDFQRMIEQNLLHKYV